MDEFTISGKYIVKEEIARGGMGVLYRALDHNLNRTVAVKVLHSHLSQDPDLAQRFLREARAMARLDHDHIVRIYAVEEQEASHYLVMEYCPGTNLQRLLKDRTQTIPLSTALHLTLQLTEALGYAHDQGIIHRDIKPANILIGPQGRPKLTDFGIAAAFDEMSFTSPGQILGTPEYMAPEQAKGEQIDARTDLYSLGIVLYELVTRKTPYRDVPQTVVLSKLFQTKDELVLEFPMSVPTLVRAVIEDLVRHQREDRTPNATTLAIQLRHILSTLPAPEPLSIPQDSISGDATQNIPAPPTAVSGDTTHTAELPTAPLSESAPPQLAQTEILSTRQRENSSSSSPPLPPPPRTKPQPFPFASSTSPAHWSSSSVAAFGGAALVILIMLGGLVFLFSSNNGASLPSNSGKPNPEESSLLISQKDKEESSARKAAEETKFKKERERLQAEQERLAQAQQQRKKEQEDIQREQARIKKEKREAAKRTVALQEEQKKLAEEKSKQKQAQQQLRAEKDRLEQERSLAKEKAERDRLAKEQALLQERLTREREERKKLQQEQEALKERLAQEQAERERLAREQQEQARLAEEQARLQERLAREQAERDRQAKNQAERERLAKKQAQQELIEKEQAERERLAKEQAEQERLAKEREEQAERDRIAKQEAEQARLAKEKAEKKRLHQEQEALQKRLVQERTERERLAKEKADLAARLAKKTAPDLQKPPPMDIATAPKTPDIPDMAVGEEQAEQLQAFLAEFKEAYETKDIDTLQDLSTMSPGRPNFLQMLFDKYDTIKVSIEVSPISDREATGTILITKLVDTSGKSITPSPILRSTKIQIRQDNNKWGKVIW